MSFRAGVAVGVAATVVVGASVGFVVKQQQQQLVSPTHSRHTR
jgi:hypothetical protein